ncbi:hypothetical protein PYR73_03050 [Acinetobacter soli]|nr:hypothetical protein PYR73_03050 [Acinetobacter soli]
MTKFYIKRDNLYLHVKKVIDYEYQDYSDIDEMHSIQFVFLKEKDGAKQFSSRNEAETYAIKRRLRNVKVDKEMY